MKDLAQNFGQVDVKSIKSEKPRSEFSEAKIEQLANLILQGGGVIRPLVLSQTGINSYVVLDGHLEYYAAVRAREKDARRGEMVSAFTVSEEKEEVVLEQIASLDEASSHLGADKSTSSITSASPSSEKTDYFESKFISHTKFDNFETRFNNFQNDNRDDLKDIKSEVQKLKAAVFEKSEDLLARLNRSSQDELEYLFSRYSVAYPKKCNRLAQAVYEARETQEGKKFKSYLDLVKSTKGFTENSMLKLINNWELYR